MKVKEVILKAMSGEYTWIQAAHILGRSARQLRRLKGRYKRFGYDGLLDRRTGKPSPRRAPFAEVERILRLYRETYHGFNIRHFHQQVSQKHGVTLSYTFVQKALQESGLVPREKKRGPHRMRRIPKACFGEMLHLDGSDHPWLSLCPEERQTLIAVIDDATSKLLYARLFESESCFSVMTALCQIVQDHGIPMSLYTDRASWAFLTPNAGEEVDKDQPTEIGRILNRLGVEHIPAYSPQARGRSERANRTLQDRLVNELRVAGIRTMEAANAYLQNVFIVDYNQRFARPPASSSNVFVPAQNIDVGQIFCFEEQRTVAKDNTLSFHNLKLQIHKQPGRSTCQGLKVIVRQHLNGTLSVWQGIRCLGLYNDQGEHMNQENEKTQSPQNLASPTSLIHMEGETAGSTRAPVSPPSYERIHMNYF